MLVSLLGRLHCPHLFQHGQSIAHRVIWQRSAHLDRLRRSLSLELGSCLLSAVDALGEENLGPQRLERVATAQPVHDPYQAVQALRVGVGDGVLEVVEDEGLPVGEGTDQVVEVRPDLGRHILAPSLVAPQGALRRVRVLVDSVEGFLEPVRLSQGRIVLRPAIKVQALFIV